MKKLVERWVAAGCLTVVRLQSVGMCARVAGVTGAALEAVLVLLAVADAVHAVCLTGRELHALNVHLCTQEETKKFYTRLFSAVLKTDSEREETVYFHPANMWAYLLGSPLCLGIKPGFSHPLPPSKQADLCASADNPHPLTNNCMCVLPSAGLVNIPQQSKLSTTAKSETQRTHLYIM